MKTYESGWTGEIGLRNRKAKKVLIVSKQMVFIETYPEILKTAGYVVIDAISDQESALRSEEHTSELQSH